MRTLLYTVLFIAAACSQGNAQVSDPGLVDPANAVPLKPTRFFDINVLVDGYYSFNANHPDSGKNNFRNFDIGADRFDLNMAKLSIEHLPDPIGFRVEVGAGRAFDTLHAFSNSETDPFRNIMQSYVSFKPKNARGLEIDFGKFLTSAGSEGTDTLPNWNYSRSLLFTNGPYFHFGLRTSIPLGEHFNAGFQLVQGWNNILDNNGGKTMGFTASAIGSKVSWFNTYYVGPEKTNTTEGWRHFYDTGLTFNPNKTVNAYINFDYGMERQPNRSGLPFYGIAGAARFRLTSQVFLASRLEWYNDVSGFVTGTSQQLKEATITGEYRWRDNISTRLEYRRDWSNVPTFDRGPESAAVGQQNTLLIGFIANLEFKR